MNYSFKQREDHEPLVVAREIKFRAWDKKTKQFIPPEIFAVGFTGHVWEWNTEKKRLSNADGQYELMQFTGLKDKNGKEVYEGDIIKKLITREGFEPEHSFTEVKWKKVEDNWDQDGFVGFTTYPAEDGEVIGNIYENPELLKEI